jgi:hypothetical protein
MAITVTNKIQNQNLETYGLIWLGTSMNKSEENLQAQQQLRTLINHLITFDDDQQCLEYIHNVSKDDRIVLIVSEILGQIIVPKVVEHRQITSIYIYCINQKPNKQWTKNFSKVRYLYSSF